MKQTPKQRRRSAQRIKVRNHFGILSNKAVRYKGLIWQIANEGTLREYQETTADMLHDAIRQMEINQ